MTEYVADSQAMVWHLFAPQRLGKRADQVLLDVDVGKVMIYLPAVVIAEMIMVVEKRRLPGAAMSQLVTRLNQMQTRKNYKFLHLDPNLVISSRTLTAIPDIFDRLIVAEALQLGLPLITSDSVIRASGLVNVIWN
jgi:PIN domain nuclease of toxin-antitoxin system